MSTRGKITGTVLGAAVAASLTGAALLGPFGGASHGEAASATAGRGDLIIAESKDGIPSATATDWVSYGDQAAVVHVTAEHEGEADSEEIAAGEGYLSRTVDLQVKERVWSRSGATALPATLTIVADGWSFKGDAKTRVGSAEASRLEVGHDYLVSFAHYADGEWATIGTGAILPYDSGEVGQGEYEGSTVTAAAYRAKMRAKLVTGAEEPLAYRASTSAASSVKTFLTSATPDATAAANYNLDAAARAKWVAKAAAAAAAAADTFCKVAAPLATDAGSTYTRGELSDVVSDLAGLTDNFGDKALLIAYAGQLNASADPAAWTSRGAAMVRVERACSIDVGLLPNDVEDAE
ncbi:hypothetical protein [Streptomyces rishiriensis]|uniref:hypothetical protein n=1 Tax=Streptomyces rishiriensis TaxID=68264 RepID=UPI0037D3DD3F